MIEPFVEGRKKAFGLLRPTVQEFLHDGFDVNMKGSSLTPCRGNILLAQAEEFFEINISAFSYDRAYYQKAKEKWYNIYHPDGKKPMTTEYVQENVVLNPIHISCGKHGKMKLHLLLENESRGEKEDCTAAPVTPHFSSAVHCHVIKDLESLVSRYHCPKCQCFFKRLRVLRNHIENKACLTCFRYTGGNYVRQKLLWEELLEEGVDAKQFMTDKNLNWPN